MIFMLFFILPTADLFAQGVTDGEWACYARDAAGTRFSPLDQINKGNIRQLEVAWMSRTGDIAPDGAHYCECTPLMVNNTVYLITPFSRAVALDAVSGEEKWAYSPDPPLSMGETGGGGLASRGVAYWESGEKRRIFLPMRDGRLISLDADSGKADPEFGEEGVLDLRKGLEEQGRFLFLSSPPAIFEDLVFQGFGINDSSSAPYTYVPLRAFDAHSGKEVWRFNTIPQPGEFGNETWEGGSWKNRSGVNVWSIMSVDTERGIVYLPVGAPNFDKVGSDRIGKNLYGNSIVALDARTGKRLWHFQMVHHDLWDYDPPAQPNLVDLTIDGEKIPAVAIAGKTGFVYVFNRVTGEPVFPIEDRPVPASDIPGEEAWVTQPFPSKPPAFAGQRLTEENLSRIDDETYQHVLEVFKRFRSEGIYTPPSESGTIAYPGQLGGANWSGAAVSPDGAWYVSANELPYLVNMNPTPGGAYPYAANARHFRDQNGYPAVAPPWGTLTKIDLNKGEIVWQEPLGEYEELAKKGVPKTGTENFGGATVTAGGLVLIAGTTDETFYAYDSDSGEVIFSYKMDAAGYGAPITYLGDDGRQYIVLYAGGGGKFGSKAGDFVYGFAVK